PDVDMVRAVAIALAISLDAGMLAVREDAFDFVVGVGGLREVGGFTGHEIDAHHLGLVTGTITGVGQLGVVVIEVLSFDAAGGVVAFEHHLLVGEARCSGGVVDISYVELGVALWDFVGILAFAVGPRDAQGLLRYGSSFAEALVKSDQRERAIFAQDPQLG